MPIFMYLRPIYLLCLYLFHLVLPPPYVAVNGVGGGIKIDNIGTENPSLPPPPPPPPPPDPVLIGRSNNFVPFKPSIAVIVGVLTTMFSITFLLLLYAKHCKRTNDAIYRANNGSAPFSSSSTARKNSGIDRTVIESLPAFRFGSLRGVKDGLECAVCLAKFETTEILRLLPKCKHAFHVECVDTWLDAHSTCPLCRYRVDAEDILLVEDALILRENESLPPPQPPPLPPESSTALEIESNQNEIKEELNRVSGRHSSAGERGRSGFLQIVFQKSGETTGVNDNTTSSSSMRRSLDSWSLKKKNESVNLGCFEHRHRKDGLLLTNHDRRSFDQRRFEHRIIVSSGVSAGRGGLRHHDQRWSDVQPSDLLYLRSEMILSDSRRYSSVSGSRPSISGRQQREHQNQVQVVQKREDREESSESIDGDGWNGRSVINSRSVSEITGLNRFSSNYNNYYKKQSLQYQQNQQQRQQRQAGLVSRWLAWISQSQPAVRSGQSAISSNF